MKRRQKEEREEREREQNREAEQKRKAEEEIRRREEEERRQREQKKEEDGGVEDEEMDEAYEEALESAESSGRVWKDKWKGLKALYLDPHNPSKGDFSEVAKWRPTAKLNSKSKLFGDADTKTGAFDFDEIQQATLTATHTLPVRSASHRSGMNGRALLVTAGLSLPFLF